MSKILTALRVSKGWNEEEVADALEINRDTYSALESGALKVKITHALKLGELYHIDPEFFIGNEAQYVNNNIGSNSKGVINAGIYNEANENSSE